MLRSRRLKTPILQGFLSVKIAKTVFYTLIGVLITVALQPVRLYEYVRFKWDNREEAVIERESEERFNNLVTNGHI